MEVEICQGYSPASFSGRSSEFLSNCRHQSGIADILVYVDLCNRKCDACKDNRNTICAIKPNSMSCIWCRVKKKKCVRNHARSTTSSKASGENLSSNAKSKGKERESHPQALHEKRAANENRSQDASSSDTDSAQQEEVIAEKRGNVHSHGHPRDATVMRNSLAAPTASAGAALQLDSWLIASSMSTLALIILALMFATI